jgi:hypothetical protein
MKEHKNAAPIFARRYFLCFDKYFLKRLFFGKKRRFFTFDYKKNIYRRVFLFPCPFGLEARYTAG